MEMLQVKLAYRPKYKEMVPSKLIRREDKPSWTDKELKSSYYRVVKSLKIQLKYGLQIYKDLFSFFIPVFSRVFQHRLTGDLNNST